LIVIRHCDSVLGEDIFTGWLDPDLSEKGKKDALKISEILKENNFVYFDFSFCSTLKRSIKTLQIVLEQLNISYVLEIKDYHLNERHYGALQGKSKTECAQKFGEEQVQIWRRNPSVRPPKVEKNDIINYPKFDRRYEMIPEELLPQSESFEDAFNRFIPFWKEKNFAFDSKAKKRL